MNMDVNISRSDAGLQEIPIGFEMKLAMNEQAMRGYASLTETEREHLLKRYREAKSREEMQKIVDSLGSDGDVNTNRHPL